MSLLWRLKRLLALALALAHLLILPRSQLPEGRAQQGSVGLRGPTQPCLKKEKSSLNLSLVGDFLFGASIWGRVNGRHVAEEEEHGVDW